MLGNSIAALKRALLVREGEMPLLLLAFGYHVCLFASYAVLRPVREETGVLVGRLEWLYAGTFLTVLVAQPLYAWLVSRLPRQRFIPIAYRFLSLNLLVFWFLLQSDTESLQKASEAAFFVWISAYVIFAVSIFWSFMADIFQPEQGKRLFGCIAAGASIGGMVGSGLATLLARPWGPFQLILVSILFLEAAALLVGMLSRRAHHAQTSSDQAPPQPVGGSALSGLARVVRSSYLLCVSAYIFLMTLANTFAYFIQRDIVKAASPDSGERTAIFGFIDFYVNLASFVIQILLAGRIIRVIGLGPTLMILPFVVFCGFAWLGNVPTLFVLIVFQIVLRSSRYGIAKPSREVLFTTVPREDKYKAKNFVDTVVYRGGDVANGFLFAALRSGGASLAALAMTVVPVAALWGGIGLALGRMHGRRVGGRDV